MSESSQPSSWMDTIITPLNACSVETLREPLLTTGQHKTPSCLTKKKDVVDHKSNRHCVWPLVIGCYQLNDRPEKEEDKTKVLSSCDGGEGGCINGDDDDDTAGGDDKESSPPGDTSRTGQLRLYMIPVPTPSNVPTPASSSTRPIERRKLSFGEPSHVLPTESGILDGKWYQRSPLHHNVFDTDRDSSSEAQSAAGTTTTTACSHMFASACASGRIHLHALAENDSGTDAEEYPHNNTPYLSSIASSSNDPSNGLCLSLDWDESVLTTPDDGLPPTRPRIVSSYSKGTVAIHTVNLQSTTQEEVFREENRWNAHTLFRCPSEVWTTCFASNRQHSQHTNLVLTGGDDCKLKLWDIRTTLDKPICTIGETEFGAGVTAVSYHPRLEHVFAAGSYDEGVRIWDIRKLTTTSTSPRQSESTLPLWKIDSVGGGVWRVKWHPRDDGRMLVGAMHGGCRVLNVRGLNNNGGSSSNTTTALMDEDTHVGDGRDEEMMIDIVSDFREHESMAYGADWLYHDGFSSKDEGGGGGWGQEPFEAAASCSFYDRRAFLWDPARYLPTAEKK